MTHSRRDLGRLALGSGAAATLASIGLATARAQQGGDYRALVTIFLYGGNDGWNSLVPIDDRHQAYATLRGPSLALAKEELIPLGDAPYGLHPALQPLKSVWDAGHLGFVMNVGTLVRPIDRATFLADPTSRPSNLSSHSDEQAHWQSMRPGTVHPDGVLGRIADMLPLTNPAPLISTNGANLALLGRKASPLILPLYTTFERVGWDAQNMSPEVVARRAAANAFAAGPHPTRIEAAAAAGMERSYAAATLVNPILTAGSRIDHHFQEDGGFRDTQMSRQLRLIARAIDGRMSLGHNSRQLFFAGQGDYDTHANQVAGGRVLGAHADLLGDLATSLKAFYNAMSELGLLDKVTVVTMSDFGRTYRGNSSAGSDHAWGNVHFMMGGALKPRTIQGLYPRQVLGAGDDSEGEGTFIPTIANEEYIGAAARWFGVSDMSYVFPNWETWSTNGRGPIPIFR